MADYDNKALNGSKLARFMANLRTIFVAKADTTQVTGVSVDTAPTQSSNNLVTSGGVYTAIGAKQNVIDSTHKLSSDLVDDTNHTNKFVSADSVKDVLPGATQSLTSESKASVRNNLDTQQSLEWLTNAEIDAMFN